VTVSRVRKGSDFPETRKAVACAVSQLAELTKVRETVASGFLLRKEKTAAQSSV